MGRQGLDQRSDFRSLVDELDGVAIWFVSGEGEFDYISDGFESIWGISPDAVRDDPSRLIETIHPADRERVRSQIQGSDPEVESSYEGRIVRPDGTVRWVQTRQFPLRDSTGEVTTVVGVNTDFTEQKRRERELATLNRILRHDVRNDMSVVLGWADLLEGHTDETGQEYVQRILDAGAHVTELTETARDYADTVTGGGDLETHPVSLRETLRHEVDLQREAFPDAEFVVDGEIPDLDVAANELLRSVFKNILNNAVRHNKGSDPVVEVRCDVDPDAVTVSIADNGPGVPDGQKASIFGEGEKGLESTGTGIGLYLVKTLIDQYEGSVAVADNEPTGSVFSVQLPRAD